MSGVPPQLYEGRGMNENQQDFDLFDELMGVTMLELALTVLAGIGAYVVTFVCFALAGGRM